MDLTRAIDGYCERMGPGLLAEPANALTNVAFLVVALWLWRRSRGIERVLCAVLAAIGLGSGLFHTYAVAWAALADTIPIAVFILLYVFAAHRHFLGWSAPWSMLGVAAFVPYLVLAARGFAALPGFAISAAYWPVPLAIAGYGVWLSRDLPHVARGLWIGAAILSLSLVARSLDAPLCDSLPLGTHFMWHLLNAVMLGWMIGVLRRQRLERGGQGR
ncbi:ceramidase domain-containing protein [Maribius pontilimi]|uniref:Ceramidase domain-containing protein n=1 Tax=Palleronia pontilimi TaxID=1964209 RepID=A0A934MEX1_9RHOB|nr:ceramidase domain-containing protein [Palleronia pontilimi]MBJ3763891.1 ceramidase domain-containing protein [Palleronia pontilimi]